MDLKVRGDGCFLFVMVMMVGVIGVCVNGENDGEVLGAPMVKTEQEAFYSAVQGFVGKWWNGSDLYPDPCGSTSIQGVLCDVFDGFWYITDLTLGPIHENSLLCDPKPEFRPELFRLQRLKSLTFFNCFVSPITIPSDNWNAVSPTLQSLEFRANPGLTGQIPTTIGDLKNLESLVLIENGLSGGLPGSIGGLPHLKRLVLAGNLLTGEIPESYGNLSELLIMDLSRNSLSGTLPLTFGALTSLLKFDLSKNNLQGEIPNEISNMKNLTLLDLSNNNFSGELSFPIREMPSLEELILSNNPITGDLMNLNWENVNGVVVLDLSNMKLTDGIPESISGLEKLRFLGLNDNSLSGNVPVKLAGLGNLSGLYVNGNNLVGKLEFSPEFYRKMGRRFGAWNNPELCFPVGRMSAAVRPFGVKVCREEVL